MLVSRMINRMLNYLLPYMTCTMFHTLTAQHHFPTRRRAQNEL